MMQRANDALVHHNINFKEDIQEEPNPRSNLLIQNLRYGALGIGIVVSNIYASLKFY